MKIGLPDHKMPKEIAIVGGGFAGMYATLALLEEGHKPYCFEKTSHLGGTWYYREESVPDVASTMPTTILNHSKEVGALSNYPPPAHYNNYMRHWEIYQYAKEYFDMHNGFRHVRLNTQVVSVRRAEDYDESGRWTVVIKDVNTDHVETKTFDGVMVCVGHFNSPTFATYPGQELFKGKIIHSHSLKGVSEYQDKRVVVIGSRCSALDAAVATSNVAKQVYLSSRSGVHVMNRVGMYGYPIDILLIRRFVTKILDILPREWASKMYEKVFIDHMFHRNFFRVKPKHHILSKDPVFNDHIFSKILSGSVVQMPDIDHFTENGVVFQGESQVTEVDNVIMATGYTWKFPFLEDGILQYENNIFNLYKCMYPVNLKHSSLCFIGFALPFGPGFPLGEVQCRWAARIISGHNSLPDKDIMMKDVLQRYEKNLEIYDPCDKISIRVDYTQYVDDIASQFGAKPDLLKLFFKDNTLFWKLALGPFVSYQFRLQGPHTWEGAREAIMTCEDRIMAPLGGGKPPYGTAGLVLRLLMKLILL